MPYTVVDLPNMTTTAAGTNSSVITLLDDAAVIAIQMTTTTTSGANIATVQVELTSTGTNFAPLSYETSGASAVTVSSSQPVIISNRTGFRQIRMAATGAMASGLTFQAVKQILV